MCEARKANVIGHVVNMIQKEDNQGLDIYLDLVKGDKEIIAEINSSLANDSDARQLIEENAPGFIGLQ